MTAIAEIRRYLEQHVTLTRFSFGADGELVERPSTGPARRYSCFAELILDQGQEFVPAPLPPEVTKGESGQCYANALRLADRRRDLRYVEGVALRIIATPHAWCVTDDGTVVDPTWDPVGTAYFGVVFDTDETFAAAAEQGVFGLFDHDHRRDHPLLRHGVLHPERPAP